MGWSHGMGTLERSHGMVMWDGDIYSIQICCLAEWKVGRILGRMAESNFPSVNSFMNSEHVFWLLLHLTPIW